MDHTDGFLPLFDSIGSVDAWVNLNAFVARITASVSVDVRTYRIGALRDALEVNIEGGVGHKQGSMIVKKETVVTVACIWVLIAGEFIYERWVDSARETDEVDVRLREQSLPWYRRYRIPLS